MNSMRIGKGGGRIGVVVELGWTSQGSKGDWGSTKYHM